MDSFLGTIASFWDTESPDPNEPPAVSPMDMARMVAEGESFPVEGVRPALLGDQPVWLVQIRSEREAEARTLALPRTKARAQQMACLIARLAKHGAVRCSLMLVTDLWRPEWALTAPVED